MHSARLVNVLVVALSAASVARASFNLFPNLLNVDARGTNEDRIDISVSLGGDTSSSSSTDSSSSSTSHTSSKTTDTTATTGSSSTTPSSSPSATPSSTPSQTSGTPSQTPSSSPSTTASPTVVVSTVVTTDSDGSTSAYITSATTTPGLSGSKGSTSGMSTQTKNTVIGVVVGVGGAIVLAAIALVAWRIWGRRRARDDSDNLMYTSGYNPVEKLDQPGSASGRTPFQSTLESYHAPTQVNTASNF